MDGNYIVMSFSKYLEKYQSERGIGEINKAQEEESSPTVTDDEIDTTNYITQTELGKRFGVAVLQMGGMLKEANMRLNDGSPTNEMMNENIVVLITMKNGAKYWRWHEHKAPELLIAAGFKLPTNITRKVIDALNEIQALHLSISTHSYPEKVWFLLEECCDEYINQFGKKEFTNVLNNYDVIDILTRKIILSRVRKIMD